jgi:hypothetical protein
MVEVEFAQKAAQLHALAGELAAAVAADTSGLLATEVLPEVFGAGRQIDLLTCRLIERADRSGAFKVDGAATTTQYVKNVSGESGAWAGKRVKLGRALADRMPMTGKAWEAGDLGIDHAQVIANTIREQDYDLALDMEGFLAEHAAGLNVEQLKTVAAELLAAAAPETSDDEAARKRAAQHLSFSETLNGMWRLDGWLDPEAGLIVSNAIAAFTRKPDPDGDVLTESAPHRRAEALVQMAKHATAHAEDCNGQGGNRSTIIVGLSHQSLVDGLGTAGTPDGKRLPAAAARRLACDAGIIPAVYGSDSQILDLGRLTRTIPAGLRRFVIARDGGCVFPGCDRPPAWTEIHHREHWTRDEGETEPENLETLCSHHHHKVHEGGWELTIGNDPDRTPWFHPPDGRPPLRGQRRPLLRPATDIPRRT